MKANKHDQGKTRYELVPAYPLEEVAKVLTKGAVKYGDRNWEKGFKWSRAFGAAFRHMYAWWRGEDKDPETGYSHLAHAICEIMFLLEFTRTKDWFDDRPGEKNE